MIRNSGGVCVEAPQGSLPRVSPRIRALQDRLLDSLPADGAWECLSPAQREAILSIHRARITRHLVDQQEGGQGSRERAKANQRTNAKNKSQSPSKVFSRYGRSRSHEDKLESETDDSGVRLQSGEATNSSNTSAGTNSHEDDSSDPGIKKNGGGGRFTKASNIERLGKKDAKVCVDPYKRKVVGNGVGNVNKIISKQLNKNAAPIPSNITLDCRNIQVQNRRMRVDKDPNLFEAKPGPVDRRYYEESKVHSSKPEISRKNILKRYEECKKPRPKPVPIKGSTSSEEYDSGINFKIEKRTEVLEEYQKHRRSGSGIHYDVDFDSDLTPSTPSPSFPPMRHSLHDDLHLHTSTPRHSLPTEYMRDDVHSRVTPPRQSLHNDDLHHINNRELNRGVHVSNVSKLSSPEPTKSSLKVGYGAKLNSSFDYRNQLNQEPTNRYSSNWNNIILSRDVPIRPSQSKERPVVDARFVKTSTPLLRNQQPNHVRREVKSSEIRYVEARSSTIDPKQMYDRGVDEIGSPKKYIRSKSLDRKYLDESTDDESGDFEVHRRTERMRRYAKANQDWDTSNHNKYQNNCSKLISNQSKSREEIEPKPKSVSAWDLSKRNKIAKEDYDEENRGFRSRSSILNKWKSEDTELALGGKVIVKNQNDGEFSRNRWQRRSCDIDLDYSDSESTRRKAYLASAANEIARKQLQRRSCDFELDLDLDESVTGRPVIEDDWDDSIDNEMKILERRRGQSPKKELSRLYPAITKSELTRHNNKQEQLKPHTRVLDPRVQPSPRIYPPERVRHERVEPVSRWTKMEGQPRQQYCRQHPTVMKQEKEKSGNALRGKFKLFKSILSR